ncbi:jg418, partial [Pararge aegeria aegeria]
AIMTANGKLDKNAKNDPSIATLDEAMLMTGKSVNIKL